MTARYLGDGLYADFDGYQVELYAHNGISKTNSVFLDGTVLAAFQQYIRGVRNRTPPSDP